MCITFITNCLLHPLHISVTHYQSDTRVHAHTYTHTNSPTINPPSLSYFLFPCCFSMLSLSLVKLLTCGVIRSYNFASAHIFSPLFKLKWPGITYFWNMRKMDFPPETFKVSHAIVFHANLVLLSSRMFFFMRSSRVGGAICETFLVCENSFEWCRVY